jgi:hypothetical protein
MQMQVSMRMVRMVMKTDVMVITMEGVINLELWVLSGLIGGEIIREELWMLRKEMQNLLDDTCEFGDG